ncbi:MAG: hypothetical protein KatS3mg115_0283 [Candidatus Poribacteria bacterium]|nr:MAG: hypothetical protein KatS3mg115_0283 [Candidatus Poribacteria bacterium]
MTESRLEAVRNDLMARGVELERVTIIRRPEDAASGSPGTLRLVLAERDHPRLQPRTETTGVQYRLLLGSFQDNRSAEELARRLQEVGFRPVLETITLEGKIWHRVLLEGFQERRDAELMRDLVRPYLDQAPLILRTPRP